MDLFITKSKTLIILDAGHGKDTPGKRSPVWKDGTQLFEWAFNRVIAKYIMDYLKLGISYVNLVPENEDISLPERARRAEEIYNNFKHDFDLIYLISIHGNAADNAPKANGIEIFTSIGITKADPIGKIIYTHLEKLGWRMRPGGCKKYPGKEANFAMLRNIERFGMPSILTENGFYTNEEECKRMMDFFWQKKIAKAHFDAIMDIERIYTNGQKIEDYF